MGMSTGGSSDGGATPNINVTPLIDVLLVLLIIFMVIAPVKPHQFEAKVPAEPKDQPPDVEIKPNPLTLVISINKDDLSVKLNNESLGNTSDTKPLEDRLTAIFNDRRSKGSEFFREGTNEVERTVFIKSPKGVKYGEVVKVIDAAKLSGAQPIGLQIDDLSE
jgi:biopolymer transport protein ExbD